MTLHRRIAGRHAPWLGALALLAATAGASAQYTAYQTSFDKPSGEEWSAGAPMTSPTGENFLGFSGDTSATLLVGKMPRHSHVVISFDLYIIGGWKGAAGPSEFVLMLPDGGDNGGELLRATFASPDVDGARQSYPDAPGGIEYAPGTGAMDSASLGFIDGASGKPSDGVYRMTYSFRHNTAAVQFNFAASGTGEGAAWGIDNIAVQTFDMEEETSPAFYSSTETYGPVGANPPRGGNPHGGSTPGDGGGGGGGGGGPPPPQLPSPGAGVVLALGALAATRRSRR